ncbi:MAG: hypothetical protein H5T84_05605, partial [Thermoleophilia bacterium]|nr:hypothetical protein [Thermoleophilia bacterium]
FWDQNGCLSSRVHFVERPAPGDPSPFEYADKLTEKLRLLSTVLPRGAWPRRVLRDTYDRYKALEGYGRLQTGLVVFSSYEDDFVVILDDRPERYWRDRTALAALVNDCRGRVIIVRPVDKLADVPNIYLRHLPKTMLQSISVAIGDPGSGLNRRFLRFAKACGACGVTALRVVGRGAFPQLAYSWDGFLPLDVARLRPPGYFTTIEFDDPFRALIDTYQDVTKFLQIKPPS